MKNDAEALKFGKYNANDKQFIARFQRVTDSIIEILSKTGARAGAAKCFKEFRIPMQRATREIKKI